MQGCEGKMNAVDLGGHSGCKILLIESREGNFVRKISADVGYNERLKKQCEKQENFQSGVIRAPKVINSGYLDDGLFFFDMEYIQGVTLSEYIKTIEIGKIRNLVNRIVDGFIHIDSDCENTAVDTNIFTNKIADLKKELYKKKNKIIDNALDKLQQHDWGKIVPSICHGDLTLENIIIRNDEVYLIDFLDSFYESWVLDIGTLLQDIQALWSYRYEESMSMNTVLRLAVFRDLLLEKVETKAPGYSVEIYYALLQKLIRIFPYTKDELTFSFLLEKTQMVMQMLDKQEVQL